jgi:hypothetical protein
MAGLAVGVGDLVIDLCSCSLGIRPLRSLMLAVAAWRSSSIARERAGRPVLCLPWSWKNTTGRSRASGEVPVWSWCGGGDPLPDSPGCTRIHLDGVHVYIGDRPVCLSRVTPACYVLGQPAPREGDRDQRATVLRPSAYRELRLRGTGSG